MKFSTLAFAASVARPAFALFGRRGHVDEVPEGQLPGGTISTVYTHSTSISRGQVVTVHVVDYTSMLILTPLPLELESESSFL